MPILSAEHDRQHPVEGDTAWSESYYFNAYDPVADVGFFTRAAVRPNEGTLDAHFALWLPGGDVAHTRDVREQREMIDTRLAVGPVEYECVEPMQRWRIRVRGPAFVQPLAGGPGDRADVVELDVDVTFEALTAAVGVDGQGSDQAGLSKDTSATTGKGHLEQAGRWTGTVAVDGTTTELTDARGNRDKSWGPRRWGGPTNWRWFSINIGDDVHVGGIRLGTPDGDLHRGWVWRNGVATSVHRWNLRTELEDDGITHRVVHLDVEDKAGRHHELRGELLRVAPLPRSGRDGRVTTVNEGLARWTYEGRTGYGIAEYLHQLDDAGRPRVPIE